MTLAGSFEMIAAGIRALGAKLRDDSLQFQPILLQLPDGPDLPICILDGDKPHGPPATSR